MSSSDKWILFKDDKALLDDQEVIELINNKQLLLGDLIKKAGEDHWLQVSQISQFKNCFTAPHRGWVFPLSLGLSLCALLSILGIKYFSAAPSIPVADVSISSPEVSNILERDSDDVLREPALSHSAELDVVKPSAMQIKSVDENGMLSVVGPFKKGEALKIVIEGRAEDVISTPGFWYSGSYKVKRNFTAPFSFKDLGVPEGRLRVKITTSGEGTTSKVLIYSKHSKEAVMHQLKDYRKLKSYYLQQERKGLWQAVSNEQAFKQGKSPAKKEFAELKKSVVRLAYFKQWQELEAIYNDSKNLRKPASGSSESEIKTRILRLKERINSADF